MWVPQAGGRESVLSEGGVAAEVEPVLRCPTATPKPLRYRILHVPARLVRGQRRRRLKIPSTWPWADAIVRAFTRIQALARPT
ncbi:hypothetical protein [Kitasatospora sp. NBC_01539]|uniref:hypothetical protein n=1 Tax=Kitasatospora sp. NBC_01539 TaxID=2903577 RepID=UPI003860282F